MSEPAGTSARTRSKQRDLCRDAVTNRDRVLAGVGVGTLYRRYPSREALLSALTQRSFRLALDAAHHAAESNDTAIDCLRGFINQTIDHGAHLVLPLHGDPVPLDQDTIDLRAEVHDTIQNVLHRGRQDGSIRPDVSALDIIVFGALLAQPLPHIPDWKLTARRPAAIHFDGLAGAAATATEQ